MAPFRGGILILAGLIALYEGWRIGHGPRLLWAILLGLVAIGVGLWRIFHGDAGRRVR